MAWFMTQCIALMVSAPVLHARAAAGADKPKVRPAAVAGAFYPADPKELEQMMDDMLARATPSPANGAIIAAVAPHAGYPYSGPVAAWTYAALKGHKYSRVVVIAPSHYTAFEFTSVYDGDAYSTPLGTVAVDKDFAQRLARRDSSIQLSDKGHQFTPDAREHAIEVELPWLQHVLGSFELVPIVMGDQSYESSRALGLALARLIQEERQHRRGSQEAAGDTLILASSDLSHYHRYDEAEKIDHKTLNALAAWDYYSMSRNFGTRVWEACGGAPIVSAMIAAERLGANKAQVLRYANSGDVTGDRSQVVGYSADLFIKTSAGKAADPPFSLDEGEKKQLLEVAHKSVESAVRRRSLLAPAPTGDPALDQERGAFVTLEEAGELRGCIGYTMPVKPLYETIRDTAALAATQDPRFPPVTEQELPKLQYEISVLSPLTRVADVQQIDVGRHGLLVKNGDRVGLLLPQVPVEQHWDRTTFLNQTCVKAGIAADCWKSDDTDIFRFTAFVFNDHQLATAK